MKITVSVNGMDVAVIETGTEAGSTVNYASTDHLGGSNIVTDDKGSIIQALDYLPFGSTRVDEQYQEYDSTQKFTGHELDDDSGLYYAQARYYDSEIGRFVSGDPLQWRVGELMGRFQNVPQALNYYSYVGNNPIIKVDPKGESMLLFPLDPTYGDFSKKVEESSNKKKTYEWGMLIDVTEPTNTNKTLEVIADTILGFGSVKSLNGVKKIINVFVESKPKNFTTSETIISTEKGDITVPKGYEVRTSDNKNGIIYQKPGSEGNANMIRDMDPNPNNPNGYVRIHNEYGQPINPTTGKPGVDAETHVPKLKSNNR